MALFAIRFLVFRRDRCKHSQGHGPLSRDWDPPSFWYSFIKGTADLNTRPPARRRRRRRRRAAIPMSYTDDSIPSQGTLGRNVRWHDQSIVRSSTPSPDASHEYSTAYTLDPATVQQDGKNILVNANLPFRSRLNIRIQANRGDANDPHGDKKIRATATLQPLDDPRYEHEHTDKLRRAYSEHYSMGSLAESRMPQDRHPISIPIDPRLHLYVRNGELFARC